MSKVMLVEDDNNLREIYEARLAAEGYEIVSAHDGEEALALAVKERPDLIISDIMMPKVSGFDMLDILRSTPETKDTKVIMMTALSQAEDRTRADKLGADRYLVKSQVTLEDVVKVAHEVLEGPAAPAPAADPVAQPADSSTPAEPTAMPVTQAPDQVQAAPDPVTPTAAEPAQPTPTTDSSPPTVTPTPPEPAQAPATEEPTAPDVSPIAVSEPPATPATVDTTDQVADPVISMPPVAPQASEPEIPVTEPAPVAPTTTTEAPAPEPVQAVPAPEPAPVATPAPTPEEPESTEERIQSFIANNQQATPAPTPEPATPTPAPVTSPSQEDDTVSTNQTTPPSSKRIIQPLNSTISDPAADLNALLAKEVEKEGINPPATNTVVAPQPGDKPTTDPNSIAL